MSCSDPLAADVASGLRARPGGTSEVPRTAGDPRTARVPRLMRGGGTHISASATAEALVLVGYLPAWWAILGEIALVAGTWLAALHWDA